MKLGILTLPRNETNRIEDASYFHDLIRRAAQLEIQVQIMTPDQLGALSFADPHSRAKEALEQLASSQIDLLWDRCRWQRSDRFQRFYRWRKHLLMNSPSSKLINEPFVNKWRLHQLLVQTIDKHPTSLFHIPETFEWSSAFSPSLLHRLNKHKTLYFKPLNGTGGRGILRIRQLTNGYQIDGQDGNRQRFQFRCVCMEELVSRLQSWTNRASNALYHQRYILQQGIATELDSFRVHDFRALIQKNQHGDWDWAGLGVRIGATSRVVSNIHAGGEAQCGILFFEKKYGVEESKRMIEKLKKASFQLGRWIDQLVGRQCELGIDWAIDPEMRIWLLEANPKPGHQLFKLLATTNGHPSFTARDYEAMLTRPLQYAKLLHFLDLHKSI